MEVRPEAAVPSSQAVNGGLVLPLQKPDWVSSGLVAIVFRGPIFIEFGMYDSLCLFIGLGDWLLWELATFLCQFVCLLISRDTNMGRNPLEGYWYNFGE